MNRRAESQLWGNSFGEQLWGTTLGSSAGEQLWGAALDSFPDQLWVSFGQQLSSFGELLWDAAFGSNFEEQLWGATVGSNFAALQSIDEQLL